MARELIRITGYPVVTKSGGGVGAIETFRQDGDGDLMGHKNKSTTVYVHNHDSAARSRSML